MFTVVLRLNCSLNFNAGCFADCLLLVGATKRSEQFLVVSFLVTPV